MNNKKKSFVSVLTLSAALLISGCSSTDTKTNSNAGGAKEEKSELEDKIVVYSPHGKDILSKFETQFEEKYSIDVEWLDMGSQEILDRVRSEKTNPQADVWWGAPSTNFNQAKDDGLLAAYQPTYSDSLDEGFHDPEWYWTRERARLQKSSCITARNYQKTKYQKIGMSCLTRNGKMKLSFAIR